MEQKSSAACHFAKAFAFAPHLAKMRLMNEAAPLLLPEMSATLEPNTPAPVPLYWEYVASAYGVVLFAMLWLVVTTYRERLRLRARQGSK